MLKVRDVVKGRFGGNFLYVNEVVRRFLRIVLLDELPTCRHRKVEDSEQLLLFLDNLVENPSVVDVGHVDIVELGQKFMVAVIVHPILLLAILPNGSLIVNLIRARTMALMAVASICRKSLPSQASVV